MIRYENVHKVFGTVDVLKGISFEIPTGKVVCILGPSGSGKGCHGMIVKKQR